MRIEVWSDIVCPWCYLGKRRLESALAGFEHPVSVEWRSFQLDPAYQKDTTQPVHEALRSKLGASPAQVRAMTGNVAELAAAEGLAYDFDNAVMVIDRRYGISGAQPAEAFRAALRTAHENTAGQATRRERA